MRLMSLEFSFLHNRWMRFLRIFVQSVWFYFYIDEALPINMILRQNARNEFPTSFYIGLYILSLMCLYS